MQRMEKGKSKSNLALRPAGLANQFLCMHIRESRVGQVLGQMSRLPWSPTASLRCLRQDLDVNVNHVTLADRRVLPCTSNCAGHTLGPGAGIDINRCRTPSSYSWLPN